MADTYLMPFKFDHVLGCLKASRLLPFSSPAQLTQTNFFIPIPTSDILSLSLPRPHRRSPIPSMPYLFFSGDKNDGLLVAVMFCWLLVD
jgi:hypothetical protein